MRILLCLLLTLPLAGAVVKQAPCIDRPRIKARKKAAALPISVSTLESLDLDVELEAMPGVAVLKTLRKRGDGGGGSIVLTDAQLEKLIAARYGSKMLARAIYVHGLREGMRTIPFD